MRRIPTTQLILATAVTLLALAPLSISRADARSSATFQREVLPFLKQHCFDCHDEREAAAGLRLDQLGTDFLAGKTADLWKEVIDRINLGEMPPEDEQRAWLHREKPRVDWPGEVPKIEPKQDKSFDYRTYQRLMFDIIALALQTDSTRVVSYMAKKDLGDGTGSYGHLGNPYDYHTLTHHGEDPERLDWLTKVDVWTMQDWAYFLGKLKSIKEGDGTLLDHTLVARSSSGGTANAHNNTLLPAMLCGGSRIGVRHQGHIVESDKSLGNLWATMLALMGVEDLPSDFMGGECDGIVKPLVSV